MIMSVQSLSDSKVLDAGFIEDMMVPEDTEPPLNPAYLTLKGTNECCSHEIVRATLLKTKIPGEYIDTISRYITKQASRTFVLLVYIDMLHCIGDLCRAGFDDRNLPLFLHKNGQQQIMYDSAKNHWKCFDRWTGPQKKYFYLVQWSFMAQPLPTNQFEHRLHEKQPLHFRVMRGLGGEGGFGVVQRVEIPIGQDVSDHESIEVALLT